MIYVTINKQFKQEQFKQFCEKQECFGSDGINCRLTGDGSGMIPTGY